MSWSFRVALESPETADRVGYPCADRIGFARLTTMAFGGTDLRPLRDQLISKVAAGTTGAGEGLDLSLIAQLLGDKPTGFLLQDSAIELLTLYVVAGVELPVPLPDHDVAIVIASDSDQCREALRKIDHVAPRWPRPLLNPPRLVGHLDRDKLHRLLSGIEGLDIPVTAPATR